MKRLLILLSLLFFLSFFAACYASQRMDKNIIIFVSFSMPDESLKGWMNEAKMIKAPVVVRGLVNNSFKDTINKIGGLAKDNQGGIQIDPALFKRFKVNKVPAVVVVKEPDCMEGMSCALEYNIIYGDVTLAYALKKIANQEDGLSPIAKKALSHLSEITHGK